MLSILVRFFNSDAELSVICHLEIIAITDFTATGIFSSLESVLEKLKIPMANLLSYTSDTCNVMKVEQGGVIAKLRTIQPRIIHVHCICHLVSLCTKSAVKILLLKVDNFLVDIIYHFQNSANRVVILQEYTEFCYVEFKGNLKHCEARWLSLRRAIDHALEVWDPLLSYFMSHADVEKPGKVTTILTLMSKSFTKLWLYFLLNVLAIFDKFNIYLQASHISTAHKLYGECMCLLKTVMTFFVKAQLIKKHSDDLSKIKYCDSSFHLPDDELFVEDSTAALSVHLSDNDGERLNEFYKGVLQFYLVFCGRC